MNQEQVIEKVKNGNIVTCAVFTGAEIKSKSGEWEGRKFTNRTLVQQFAANGKPMTLETRLPDDVVEADVVKAQPAFLAPVLITFKFEPVRKKGQIQPGAFTVEHTLELDAPVVKKAA